MVGLASELSLQLHRSSSPGNCWLSDLCEMPVSSSERGQGSGDEGEGFLLFLAIPSCCLPPGGGRGVWATCPSCPLAAHQHAVPADLRGLLLALCLQGYGQGGFGREAERGVSQASPGPTGKQGPGRNPGFPKLPSLCVAPISVLPSGGDLISFESLMCPFKHWPLCWAPRDSLSSGRIRQEMVKCNKQ